MGRVWKDEPYSSVISSGSTSPRKWPLKSSCRQEARTDSCSESKSSWVVRGGETVTTQTQAPCPHYPEPLSSSASSSSISKPRPQQKGPIRRRGSWESAAWGALGWAGWAAPSLRGQVPPHLQDLVHDFLHDLTLGLCVTTEQKGEEISGTRRRAEGGTHTRNACTSTLACTQTKHRNPGNPGCGEGASGQRPRRGGSAQYCFGPGGSSTQNVGGPGVLRNKAAPSQPTPCNLNCRRHLLCSFSHFSTHPHQNPSKPTSLPPTKYQADTQGRHPPPLLELEHFVPQGLI